MDAATVFPHRIVTQVATYHESVSLAAFIATLLVISQIFAIPK